MSDARTSKERTYAPGDWLETDGRLAVAIETPQVFVLFEDGTTAHVPLHFTSRTGREPKITVADLQRARRELKAWLARPVHETSAECRQLDPINHYFWRCEKGHVPYYISFEECPSCKIERERPGQKTERPRSEGEAP